MATSLSRQLTKLQTAQTDALLQTKRVVSILYTPEQAGSFSKDTYFSIGSQGFSELLQINTQFNEFTNELFSAKTKELQRAMLTLDENRKLDLIINKFLIMVSPYLELQAAKKALEWLVQRFVIHEMNVDALMLCILPFYETNLFSRILQIMNLQRKKASWGWLIPLQESGLTLPKRSLFLHWSTDEWFRNFVANSFLKVKDVLQGSEMKVHISFFITTQVGGILSSPEITENHLTVVVRTLGQCLSSQNNEIICGTYILLNVLSAKAQLSSAFVELILENVCKNALGPFSPVDECTVCLLRFCYDQRITKMSAETAEYLYSNKTLMNQISSLARTTPVAYLVSSFVCSFIPLIFCDGHTEEITVSKFEDVIVLIESMPLSSGEATHVLKTLVAAIHDQSTKITEMKSMLNMEDILWRLEKNHPACLPVDAHEQLVVLCSPNSEYTDLTKVNFGIQTNDIEMDEVEKPMDTAEPLKDVYSGWIEDLNLIAKESFSEMTYQATYPEPVSKAVDILRSVCTLQSNKNSDVVKYRMILKLLFKEKLTTLKQQLYFLSFIWCRYSDASMDDEQEQSFKLWSLKLAKSQLESSVSEDSLKWITKDGEMFLFSLLFPLCESERELREVAMEFLEIVVSANATAKKGDVIGFVKVILKHKEEILDDISYLPMAVSTLMKKGTSNSQKVYDNLVKFVVDSTVPFEIKALLLYTLSDVNDVELLSQLIPVGNSILTEAKLLPMDAKLGTTTSLCLYYVVVKISRCDVSALKDDRIKSLFMRCIGFSNEVMAMVGKTRSPRDLVTDHQFLTELARTNVIDFVDVLDTLITVIVESEELGSVKNLRKELTKTTLQGSQFLTLLNRLDIGHTATSVKEARAKRLKRKCPNEEDEKKKLFNWRKFEFIIEFVQILQEIHEPWLLIGPLFNFLQASLHFEAAFHDILQQRVLSTIYHLMEICSKSLSSEKFQKLVKPNVASLVHAIRVSVNPETHRRALLILSMVAPYFPKEVLTNIIPIFTFMGSSLLRRDDSYSIKVIETAIGTIIPALIQVKSNDPSVLLTKSTPVVQVFVDALPDIPEHRKLPLFTQLATIFAQQEHLWLLMALIADSHVFQGIVPATKREGRFLQNINFILLLYSQFSVLEQFKATNELLNFIIELPESKEEYLNMKAEKRPLHTLAINMETHTPKQLRQLKYICVGLLIQMLSSKKLSNDVKMMNFSSDEEKSEVFSLLEKILGKIIIYHQEIKAVQLKDMNTSAARFSSVLQKKISDLLGVWISLLPPSMLFKVVSSSIKEQKAELRNCALEILVSKLQPGLNYFQKEDMVKKRKFIMALDTIGCNSNETDQARQIALLALQSMVKTFGYCFKKSIIIDGINCFPLLQNKDISESVRIQVLLLATEAVGVWKQHCIRFLNSIMQFIIEILESSLEEPCTENYTTLVISITALQKVVKLLPTYMSNHLPTLISLLCRLTTQVESSSHIDIKCELSSAMQEVMTIAPRIIFLRLSQVHDILLKKDVLAYPVLMQQMDMLMSTTNSKVIYENKPTLLQFFKLSLTVRIHKGFSADTDRVEDSIFISLVNFMLKFHEEECRTIYSSILQDSLQKKMIPSEAPAIVTFFRFSNHAASTMNKLFIKIGLADKALEVAADLLDENSSENSNKNLFASGKSSEKKTCELLIAILDALSTIFRHASGQLINRRKYEYLLLPLTNQLNNTIGGDSAYKERVAKHLTPCIVQFAVSSQEDVLWVELNNQIFSKVQNSGQPMIILSSLEVFEAIIDTLSDDYLQPMLSSIMIYIVEALEITHPEIQNKSKQIFIKMEGILGQNLRAYLE